MQIHFMANRYIFWSFGVFFPLYGVPSKIWRRGIVVIVSTSKAEDPWFESREVVRYYVRSS
jgi:hypothetical protein